jgi:predicted RNA polymerase sigma factor
LAEIAWIDVALTAARPKAVAALLRYFRDLDIAEEAFQEACLKALTTWTEKGPPRARLGSSLWGGTPGSTRSDVGRSRRRSPLKRPFPICKTSR